MNFFCSFQFVFGKCGRQYGFRNVFHILAITVVVFFLFDMAHTCKKSFLGKNRSTDIVFMTITLCFGIMYPDLFYTVNLFYTDLFYTDIFYTHIWKRRVPFREDYAVSFADLIIEQAFPRRCHTSDCCYMFTQYFLSALSSVMSTSPLFLPYFLSVFLLYLCALCLFHRLFNYFIRLLASWWLLRIECALNY